MVKEKLSLCLIKHHATDTYGILTTAIDVGEWLTSRCGHFNPGEKADGTRCIGGSVALRVGLDMMAKRPKHQSVKSSSWRNA
jgi:hypothetical protein